MGVFDLKSLLLARHAQHVVLIHFPIALLIVGVAFDLAGQWRNRPGLAAAAYFNLLIAAASTPFVIVSGILAWRWQLEGAHLRGNLLLHLVLGLASAVLICSVGWVHRRARKKARPLPFARIPLELIAVITVALTGHLGGFLSGVNN